MYNYSHVCANNWQKEYAASNQVVGGSNPSGCAKLIKHLAHFRKFELSHKNKNIKVVIYDCETMIALKQTSER